MKALTLIKALFSASFCVLLSSPIVTANADENQQSCMTDAIAVCSQFIPDRELSRTALSLTAAGSRKRVRVAGALQTLVTDKGGQRSPRFKRGLGLRC